MEQENKRGTSEQTLNFLHYQIDPLRWRTSERLNAMLAIAIATFLSCLGLVALATIGLSVANGIRHGRAIVTELAALDRQGGGVAVIALPPLRSRGSMVERAPQLRKAVTLRPVRRPCAAA